MAAPEDLIDEDRNNLARKYEIGPAGDVFSVQPISRRTRFPKGSPEGQFRLGVLCADGRLFRERPSGDTWSTTVEGLLHLSRATE